MELSQPEIKNYRVAYKGWDIEITGGGKPEVILYGKAKELAKQMNIFNIHISLSHEEDKAIAFAISELDK